MARTCTCPSCPALARLEAAKDHYRAQQTAIARLRELLTRYQRIGVRRLQENSAISLVLVGTESFYKNQALERAVQRRDRTIQHLEHLIAALKTLHGEGRA